MKKRIFVAKAGEVLPGRVKTFSCGARKGIAYNDNGTLKAYQNVCTHAGGPVRLCEKGTFQCEFHEAEFDPKTGERLCGEAPEGSRLTPIELFEEGGDVFAEFEFVDEFDF